MANFSGTTGDDFVHVAGDGHSGAGNEIALATDLSDTIDVSQGGDDTVFAGDGTDTIILGAAFTSADRINGQGGNNDTVNLSGDYSAGVKFGGRTMVNVETVIMFGGNDYKLTLDEKTIAASTLMTFDASRLGAADRLILDASEETDGTLSVYGGAGDDVIKGGSNLNTFVLGTGGHDTAIGGAGLDFFHGGFDAHDRLDGGGGDLDELFLDGDVNVKFKAHTLENVESIDLLSGDYKLTLHENTVAAGKSLSIGSNGLGIDYRLIFDASADTDGFFTEIGGTGNDRLTGGAHGDRLTGGAGNDALQGGGGQDALTLGDGFDVVVFATVSDSRGTDYDTVTGFDFLSNDKFDMPGTVAGVDTTVGVGFLDSGSFQDDLVAAIGNLQLGAGDAVLFTPDSGDLSGHTFLIVDGNGSAGYQKDADYVIELTGAGHINDIDSTDFI